MRHWELWLDVRILLMTIGEASYAGGERSYEGPSPHRGQRLDCLGVTIMDHNFHSVTYYGEREKDTLRAYLAQHAQSCPVADDLYPTGSCLPSSAKNTRESIVSVASSMTAALRSGVQ